MKAVRISKTRNSKKIEKSQIPKLVFLVVSVFLALVLVLHRQEIRQSAASPNKILWQKVGETFSSVFVDLDQDGQNELVFGGRQNVTAYKPDGTQIWSYAIPEGQGLDSINALATGDVTGDKKPEIVFGTQRTKVNTSAGLYVLSSQGKLLWSSNILFAEANIVQISTPTLVDVNTDGILDIVVGVRKPQNYAQLIRAYTGSGKLLWTRKGPAYGYSEITSSSMADLDGDGIKEIVTIVWSSVTPFNSQILTTKLNGSDFGVTIQNTQTQPGNAPILADVDKDGKAEIIVTANTNAPNYYIDGNIYIYQINFKKESLLTGWPKTVAVGYGLYYSSPAVADIDGDGYLEIFMNGKDGFLYGWHYNGTPVQGWPIAEPLVKPSNDYFMQYDVPLIADLDGDQKEEILFNGLNCNLLAFNPDGTHVAGYPFRLTNDYCYIYQATLGVPAGSTSLHLGVSTGGKYGAFFLNSGIPFNSTRFSWPMFRHDGQRTGAYVKAK